VDVREAIAAVFQALSRGEAVPAEPLTVIEAACRDAWSARSLRPAGRSGAAWEWRDESSAPHRPAWTAALDAARILTSEDRTRIRECGDAACGWLFLDASRNRSRRWCTMEGCGNRNKARNFYRRSSKQ
jgi:predicted RNA-binding Zn ribbon-like protein